MHGSTVDFGDHGYTGFNKGQVVFNLPDAGNVLLNGGINAALLATNATVGQGWGQINGQVVVNNWYSSVQVNARCPQPGAPQSQPGSAPARAGVARPRGPGSGCRSPGATPPRLIIRPRPVRQRRGEISRSAFTAPEPMAAPNRLAKRSATLSLGV